MVQPSKARFIPQNVRFLKENDKRKENYLIYDFTVTNSLKQLCLPSIMYSINITVGSWAVTHTLSMMFGTGEL